MTPGEQRHGDPRVPDIAAGQDQSRGAGLTMSGRKRRVPGLRRDEVALLADISVVHHLVGNHQRAHGADPGKRGERDLPQQVPDAHRLIVGSLQLAGGP